MPNTIINIDNVPGDLAQRLRTWKSLDGYTLFPYQAAGAYLMITKKHALLADDQGIGKTAQAIVAATVVGGKKIVICPPGVAYQWAREILNWSQSAKVADVQIVQSYKQAELADTEWTIITHYAFPKRKTDIKKQSIKTKVWIIDEVHYLKGENSERTIAILGGWRKNKGVRKGLAEGAQYLFGLTGTPIPNRSKELLPLLWRGFQLDFARPAIYRQEYCDPQSMWNVHLKREVETYNGSSNNKKLSDKLYGSVMIRRLKPEIGLQMSKKERYKVYLNPDGMTKTNKKKFHNTLIKVTDTNYGGSGEMIELPDFEEMSEERKFQALATAPLVAEYIKSFYAEVDPQDRRKMLVFCHHPEMAAKMKEASDKLKIPSALLVGSTTPKKREIVKDNFANGETLILYATIGAAGTGIDGLQKSCDLVLFAELPPVPGDLVQAEDRLHRLGQKSTVTVLYLIVPGSLNEHMLKLNFAKATKINVITADVTTLPSIDELDELLFGRDDKELIDSCTKLIGCVPDNVNRVCKKISQLRNLTDKQAAYALRIVSNYRRML